MCVRLLTLVYGSCGRASDFFLAFGLCGLEYIVLWLLAKIGPPLWGLKWWYGYKLDGTFGTLTFTRTSPSTFTTSSTKTIMSGRLYMAEIQTWNLWSSGKVFSSGKTFRHWSTFGQNEIFSFKNEYLGQLQRNNLESGTSARRKLKTSKAIINNLMKNIKIYSRNKELWYYCASMSNVINLFCLCLSAIFLV